MSTDLADIGAKGKKLAQELKILKRRLDEQSAARNETRNAIDARTDSLLALWDDELTGQQRLTLVEDPPAKNGKRAKKAPPAPLARPGVGEAKVPVYESVWQGTALRVECRAPQDWVALVGGKELATHHQAAADAMAAADKEVGALEETSWEARAGDLPAGEAKPDADAPPFGAGLEASGSASRAKAPKAAKAKKPAGKRK